MYYVYRRDAMLLLKKHVLMPFLLTGRTLSLVRIILCLSFFLLLQDVMKMSTEVPHMLL